MPETTNISLSGSLLAPKRTLKVGVGHSSSDEAISEAGLFVALHHGLAMANGFRIEK